MKQKHPDIVATITNGQLVFHIPRLLQAVLAGIGEGALCRVDVKKFYKKRTDSQNATIWGPDYALILAYIFQTTGQSFEAEELHRWHKEKFLGFEASTVHPGLHKLRSTKVLNTAEFVEFREKYCKYWAGCGLWVPDPDPAKKKRKEDRT
jgi:hypothetical protein